MCIRDSYRAIDLALDKAETQLTRLKEKKKEHRGKHAAVMEQEEARGEQTE